MKKMTSMIQISRPETAKPRLYWATCCLRFPGRGLNVNDGGGP